MEAVLVLLILLASGNAASFSNNPSEPKSLVFQSTEGFISTSDYVGHMELDQHENDGTILFADWTALKTVTKYKRVSTVMSGFKGLTSFKQLNWTHLVAVDSNAHSVKMVNRVHNSAKPLSGQFNYPWAAEKDVRNSGKLIITEYGNHALKSVDVNSGVVSTVISYAFKYPRGMAWNKDRLLVTNKHYISEVVWKYDGTVTNTRLTGSTTAGSADGDFTTSRFSHPYDISPITSSWFLVADYGNKKLRLLDVTRREVLSVCTNTLSPCTESTDLGYSPRSVLQTADAVYVGGRYKITKLTEPDIRRRLTFQADYDVKCDQAVAAVAKNIIFSIAQQHFDQIKQLCGKYCKPIGTRKPVIACANDTLRIQWPTDLVYGGETLDIKPDVKSALKRQLSGVAVSALSLVVPSKIPPVVYPVRNSDGDLVTFTLTSFCAGNSTYNPQTDHCQ